MAWTATLRDLQQGKDKWTVSIIYNDGVTALVKEYTLSSISDQAIKDTARGEVARFTAASTVPAMTITPMSPIDLTPPTVTPPTPTPSEVAESNWLTGFNNLLRLRKMADSGLISQNDIQITSLVTTLKSTYLSSYLAKINP